MRTLTLFLLLAVPAAAQDLSDVVAAMEKAVEPIKDLVILEEGSIKIQDSGEMFATEFRTQWVRGQATRVDASATIRPIMVRRGTPAIQILMSYVETPELFHFRAWVPDLPPIAKGLMVPYLNFRIDLKDPALKELDPLALPPEFPARLMFDRLLLRATLEPKRWIPAGAELKRDGDEFVVTDTTAWKKLIPVGTFPAALPVGAMNRTFRIDAKTHRLNRLILEFPMTMQGGGGPTALTFELSVNQRQEVEGVSLPSETVLKVKADIQGRMVTGFTMASTVTEFEANMELTGEFVTRGYAGAPKGADPLLKSVEAYGEDAAEGYSRALARSKAALIDALKNQEDPEMPGADVIEGDLRAALKGKPTDPFLLAAALEMSDRFKEKDVEAKVLEAEAGRPFAFGETSLLIARAVETKRGLEILRRAFALETVPFLQRKIRAERFVRQAKSGASKEAAGALGEAMVMAESFGDARRLSDALILSAITGRLSSEKLEEMVEAAAKAAPEQVGVHYLRAGVALRDDDLSAWAGALKKMVGAKEAPAEALTEAVRQIRTVFLGGRWRMGEGGVADMKEVAEEIGEIAAKMIEREPDDPFGHFLMGRALKEGGDEDEGAAHTARGIDRLEKAIAAGEGWTSERVDLLVGSVELSNESEATPTLKRVATLFLSCAETDVDAISFQHLYGSNPAVVYAGALIRDEEYAQFLKLITLPGFAPLSQYAYSLWSTISQQGTGDALMEEALKALDAGTLTADGCAVLAGAAHHVRVEEVDFLEFLERASDRFPKEANIWFQLGKMRKSKQEGDFLEAYRKSIELWRDGTKENSQELSNLYEALLAVAESLGTTDPTEAKRMLGRIDLSTHWDTSVARRMVELFVEMKDPEAAVTALRPMAEGSGSERFHLDFAIALEAAGRLLEAAKHFARAVEYEKKNQWAYSHHGQGFDERPAEKALKAFQDRVNNDALIDLFLKQKFDPLSDAEKARVRRLLGRIRSDDAGDRDAAQAELVKMGRKIAPALREAANDDDREVRSRVRSLLNRWINE